MVKRSVLILLVLLAAMQASYAANDVEERRVRIGLKLFRALLAADQDITTKTTTKGALLLLLIYGEQERTAETFARELEQLGKGDDRGKIRKIPIEVQTTNAVGLVKFRDQRVAGLYLVEDLPARNIDQLAAYGVEHQSVVYSPFPGDVDRGILAGLAIESRVRPYINLETMTASKIRIKKFFLKAAKHHEP